MIYLIYFVCQKYNTDGAEKMQSFTELNIFHIYLTKYIELNRKYIELLQN